MDKINSKSNKSQFTFQHLKNLLGVSGIPVTATDSKSVHDDDIQVTLKKIFELSQEVLSCWQQKFNFATLL